MYFVGICGPSGSGKTTVCKKVMDGFRRGGVAMITLDSFYTTLTPAQVEDVANYNFDTPDAFDFAKVHEVLKTLRETGRAEVPRWSYTERRRLDEHDVVENCDVVLFEGILTLHDEAVRKMMDLSIYVDCDLDQCLIRRIRRDIAKRGRNLESVLAQYELTVKPSYETFIFPERKHADVIITRGGSNTKAVEMVIDHITAIITSAVESPRHSHYEVAYNKRAPTPVSECED
eukprot:Rhum_TRINITY_DN3551_c0_g1::Rhum_TRINITY_DN3551_c0_g1_i1::g.11180::m.11180/K00876/udk, UCK; uridine kinase